MGPVSAVLHGVDLEQLHRTACSVGQQCLERTRLPRNLSQAACQQLRPPGGFILQALQAVGTSWAPVALCDPTDCSTPGLHVHRQHPELKLTSVASVMPSTVSSSVVPFSSCPQSFPASGSFPMSQVFASGGHNIGVSASAYERIQKQSPRRRGGCRHSSWQLSTCRWHRKHLP